MISMDKSNKILIACYGTLRKGFSNSVLVDRVDNYLGKGITVEKYQMLAHFIPYVNKTPDTQITVDLWEIDKERDLPAVDRLEGYDPNDHDGSWYKRELIDVDLNGNVVKAWLYFNNSSFGSLVESGDFEDYTKKINYVD